MRLELTRRTDYAIRALLVLAREGGRQSTPVIAAAMNIPIRFLPQVMGDLTRAGLVGSTAGREGGYELIRPAAAIDLLEIIEAVEGDTRRRTCILRGGPCRSDGICDAHEPFGAAQEAFRATLAGASLASLAARSRGLDVG
jgi:Rrf2 family transcriptional regulator, iron-sulfur cluster assembly transcription factor